jgi:hypothetical protein
LLLLLLLFFSLLFWDDEPAETIVKLGDITKDSRLKTAMDFKRGLAAVIAGRTK